MSAPVDEHIPEMQLEGGTSITREYTSGVILAALYAVSALIPISAFVGSTGPLAELSLTICVAPLFGLLLGPSRGFVFGLIGGIITAFLPGVSLLVPTVILGPAISGLLAGLCLQPRTRIRSYSIPGPLVTALYLGVVMILYLMLNLEAWWFMAYYLLAFAAALMLQIVPLDFDSSALGVAGFLQLLPHTLIGTITDFSMMTIGAVFILQIPAEVFGFVIFPLMLAERTVAIIVAAIAIAIIVRAFPEVNWAILAK